MQFQKRVWPGGRARFSPGIQHCRFGAAQQAEDVSDKLLDGVADAASKVTGGKFDEQIGGAQKAADGAVGTEK